MLYEKPWMNIKQEYEKEEALRREEQSRLLREQLESLRRRIKSSGAIPEEYILLLEKRIRELENIYIEHHSYGSKERIIRETWDTYEKAAAAVPVMAWDYDEHAYKETGEYQFDGKTAAKCLELLMKHHGMLKEKVDASFGTCEGEKLEITVVHEHESTENEHGGAEFEHGAKDD